MFKFAFLLSLIFALSGCSKESEKKKSEPSPPADNKITNTEKASEKNEVKKPEKVDETKVAIPICEKYINYVCQCSNRFPENDLLKNACTLAKSSLPEWKKNASTAGQFDFVVKSCQDAIYSIKATGGCGEIP